jgi:flagellar protein FlgJ
MKIGGLAPIGPAREIAPVRETREVEAQATPVTRDQIRAAIGRAYAEKTGRAPSAGFLDVLTAQSSLETASGKKMFNFNFGGIKGHGPSGMTARYGTTEVIDGQTVKIRDGFRAYASLEEGASDYLSLLSRRYPGAIAAAERGDVDAFAHELKARGYYTASEDHYRDALRGLVGMPRGTSAPEIVPPEALALRDPNEIPQLDSGALARVLEAVNASTARIASPIDDV